VKLLNADQNFGRYFGRALDDKPMLYIVIQQQRRSSERPVNDS
jgi:uncharacterized protein (DUF3820 family)